MGDGRRQRGARVPWILIHDTNKVKV